MRAPRARPPPAPPLAPDPEHDASPPAPDAPQQRPAPDQAAGPPGEAGRHAPAPPPHKGWAIVRQLAVRFARHRILEEAASVAFYTLLAIFPATASLVTLYGLFADPRAAERQLAMLSSIVPAGGMRIITQQVHGLARSGNRALGLGLAASVATSLWVSARGVKSLCDALNVVYDVQDNRGTWRFTAITLAISCGGLLTVLLVLAGAVLLPVGSLGLGGIVGMLLRWLLLLAMFAAFQACLHRYGPDRPVPAWRWVSPGSVLATVVWAGASIAFSWYVSHFGSFNRTYGSLGAGVGLMTWIWISAVVVLMGAELDAALEERTEALGA